MDAPLPSPATVVTTAVTTIATTHVKNFDPDPPIQPNKHFSPTLANGVLKRLKPLQHHTLQTPVVVSYKECLKNHAASTGGHVVDGCGEFMVSPASTPTDPSSLKCAACGCHRNFHRREPPEGSFHSFQNKFNNHPLQHVVEYQPHHRHHRHHPPPPPQPVSPADSPSPPPISSSYYPHMLLSLRSGLPESTGNYSSTPVAGKKRFRTKFSQEQKEKMHELAEHVGWKMQKKDEELIIGICNEIGVDKGVFKVWMHNNKMTLAGKKDSGDHQQQQRQLLPNNDSISSGDGNGTATNGSYSSS